MDGSGLSYFTTITSDATVYDFDGAAPDPRIIAPGLYLVMHYSDWSTTTGVPAVGTRVLLTLNVTFSAGGGSKEWVHSGELSAGILDSSAVAGHFVWQTRGIRIVNVPAGTSPVRLNLTAANTGASVIGSDDTAVTVVRIADTPFAGSF